MVIIIIVQKKVQFYVIPYLGNYNYSFTIT